MQYIFSDKIASLKASAIREILKFTADPSVISFAAGNPAPEAFPTNEVERISKEIFSSDPIGALQYSISEGYTPLRNKLKEDLSNKGVRAEDDELIITSGAQQAMDLVCKCLCNNGDEIICENPSFIGSLNAFRSYDVKLLGAPVMEDGIDTDALEELLKTHSKVKFIYLIPNFQNPTGITMSLEKRKAVLALARKYNVLILEDDPYGELRFKGDFLPSIKSMDTDGHVAYVGTFSKILAPGIRVGYLLCNKELMAKIVVAKQVSDVHTNIWAQMLCYKFLTECDLNAHLEGIRKIYDKKCSLMLSELDKHLGGKITYTRPEGGLFIWCTLPEEIDMFSFCKTAVENKVAVVPGSAFSINEGDKTNSFRINFSTPKDEQIIKGVEILGSLL